MVNFTDLNNVGESLPEKDHRFKHKMSMIEFTVIAGEGIEASKSDLQSITLDKIKTQGKINVKTGATEVTGTSSLKTLPVTGFFDRCQGLQVYTLPATVREQRIDH